MLRGWALTTAFSLRLPMARWLKNQPYGLYSTAGTDLYSGMSMPSPLVEFFSVTVICERQSNRQQRTASGTVGSGCTGAALECTLMTHERSLSWPTNPLPAGADTFTTTSGLP